MAYSSRMRSRTRATRVGLHGKISVLLQLENGRQLSGKLHQLSVTGGLVELATYIDERTKVGLAVPIGGNVVRPDAEMLFPIWGAHGYLQPFRFTRLWAQERQVLEAEITALLQQTVARSVSGQGGGLRPRNFYSDSF